MNPTRLLLCCCLHDSSKLGKTIKPGRKQGVVGREEVTNGEGRRERGGGGGGFIAVDLWSHEWFVPSFAANREVFSARHPYQGKQGGDCLQ